MEFLVWFGGLLVGSIITLIIHEWLLSSMSHLFAGRVSKDRTIKGTWNTLYEYITSEGDARVDDPKLEVRTLGRYFFATGQSTKDGSKYKLRGEIHAGNVITGYWYEWTASNKYYFGVFQLELSKIEESATGRWLGHSREGIVKSGTWSWVKEQ